MSVRYLFIGDVHAQANDLADCQKLVDFIETVATQNKANNLIFLGDQYNDHAIVNAAVINFWYKAFEYLEKSFHVIALAGNHDQSGSTTGAPSPMLAHKLQVNVVDQADTNDAGDILFLPYYDNKEAFVKACNDYPAKLLVCHQSFEGAQFENGFYDPNGIDQKLIPQENVISGHIHKEAQLGKVHYVGSPRWRTRSDANQDKAIWIYDIQDGKVLSRRSFDTSKVCRKVHVFEERPGIENDYSVVKAGDRVFVDVYGPESYIKDRKALLSRDYKVRSFADKLGKVEVRESEGVQIAFDKWFKAFKPKNGTDLKVLEALVQERLKLAS